MADKPNWNFKRIEIMDMDTSLLFEELPETKEPRIYSLFFKPELL